MQYCYLGSVVTVSPVFTLPLALVGPQTKTITLQKTETVKDAKNKALILIILS